MELTKKIEIELPILPNFIRRKRKSDKDFNAHSGWSIDEFTDEQLKEIGLAWTAALVALAQKKRLQNKK
jgi:hypothetical protein